MVWFMSLACKYNELLFGIGVASSGMVHVVSMQVQ